jgi:hypothetical protein
MQSPHFRIFSSVRALPGQWQVEVKDQNGKVLDTKNFEVQGVQDYNHTENNTIVSAPATKKKAKADSSIPKGVSEALRSLEPTHAKTDEIPSSQPNSLQATGQQ